MGIRTVAVYSEADSAALHLTQADEARLIGPPAPAESYLRGDKMLEAAAATGAQAIHPGYGFLSENDRFAEACAHAGIEFIGPPPAAIRSMGNKSGAKAIMEQAGVPVVPGFHGENQDADHLAQQARKIGFPVLIKASAGGGGKGMRVVESAADFARALESCRRESLSAFGDDRVILERYIEKPRHIEVQIFGDRHGDVLHLFERDCSIQRRYQKVIEEAPSPRMTPELRAHMGATAVSAARAIGYFGAGTVEFIVDPDGHFYFMEMNTRLQVEHPVTEMITGLDLVEWQLRVAAGERLPLAQEEIPLNGHAIEARVYAEDPAKDFLPSTGRLAHLVLPADTPHVRVDPGVRQGDIVSPHYDPLIAKIIAWGLDRPAAIRRLQAALDSCQVVGLETNASFLRRLVGCAAFIGGATDTGLIPRNRAELIPGTTEPGGEVLALATLAELLTIGADARRQAAGTGDPHSPWGAHDGWRLNEDNHHTFLFHHGERQFSTTVHYRAAGFEIEIGAERYPLNGEQEPDGAITAWLGDRTLTARVVRNGVFREVFSGGEHFRLRRSGLFEELDYGMEPGGLTAPMPGKIVALLVDAGERVEKGAPLLILEAMKMEHHINAPGSGSVREFFYQVGDQVREGVELLDFDGEAE